MTWTLWSNVGSAGNLDQASCHFLSPAFSMTLNLCSLSCSTQLGCRHGACSRAAHPPRPRGAAVRLVYILGILLVHSRKQLGIASIDPVDSVELFRTVRCYHVHVDPHIISLCELTSSSVTVFTVMYVLSLSSYSVNFWTWPGMTTVLDCIHWLSVPCDFNTPSQGTLTGGDPEDLTSYHDICAVFQNL